MTTPTPPTKNEIALLTMLSRGQGFTSACRALGDEGVQAGFQCMLKRWINGGAITREGREALSNATKPKLWEITILPPEKANRKVSEAPEEANRKVSETPGEGTKT